MESLADLVTRVTVGSGLLPLSVPATVTTPGGAPVAANALWSTATMDEFAAAGALQRREVRRVLVLLRSEVPTVPRKTIIVAPEKPGGANKTWRVDGTDFVEATHRGVLVIEEPA